MDPEVILTSVRRLLLILQAQPIASEENVSGLDLSLLFVITHRRAPFGTSSLPAKIGYAST